MREFLKVNPLTKSGKFRKRLGCVLINFTLEIRVQGVDSVTVMDIEKTTIIGCMEKEMRECHLNVNRVCRLKTRETNTS